MLNNTLIARNKCYGKGRGPNAVKVCHCAISPQLLLPPFLPAEAQTPFSPTPTMFLNFKSTLGNLPSHLPAGVPTPFSPKFLVLTHNLSFKLAAEVPTSLRMEYSSHSG